MCPFRSHSGPYFPALGLNTERCLVSLRSHSHCGKIRTRITPNTDTFYAVLIQEGAYQEIFILAAVSLIQKKMGNFGKENQPYVKGSCKSN